jgi:hypothetical protein
VTCATVNRKPRLVLTGISALVVFCGILVMGMFAEPASAFEPTWVEAHRATQLWSGPDDGAVSFGSVGQWSFFQVIAPQGASRRLHVLNPSTGNYAYIDASAVGPSGPSAVGISGARVVMTRFWVQNFKETQLWSGIDARAVSFGGIAQWSYLQVVAVQDGAPRLYVMNPKTMNYAYVDATAVGPSGPPADMGSVGPDGRVGSTAPSGPGSASAMAATTAPLPVPADAAFRTLPTLPAGVSPSWVANFEETELWSGVGSGAVSLGSVPQFRRFLVMDAKGDRLKVWSPEKDEFGFIDRVVVGPTGPSVWMSARLPRVVKHVNLPGRSVSDAAHVRNLAAYDDETELRKVPNNISVDVGDLVVSPDGTEWYTVGDREYILASEVRLPRPVETPLSGRWIDADLSEPTLVTAYEGDKPVRTMLAIRGVDGTPTVEGTFKILRRVATDTMDSETIGIPRESPKGYLLKDVLYTQYFTSDGAALHYNYWLGRFGYPGSHGCLGLSLEDSKFLWDWAQVGTPVVVRSSAAELQDASKAGGKSP